MTQQESARLTDIESRLRTLCKIHEIDELGELADLIRMIAKPIVVRKTRDPK